MSKNQKPRCQNGKCKKGGYFNKKNNAKNL